MIELGVNIDHVATLRQARRTYEPDPVWAAVEAQLGGADLITMHLREDRRHIQDDDLRRVRQTCQVRLNMEMAATEEMVAMAGELKPHLCTLVPEGRMEVTTEGGLDVAGQLARLKKVTGRLRTAGIMVSAFIDADAKQVDAAAAAGFSVCEIHTGPYAAAFEACGADFAAPALRDELEAVAKMGRRMAAAGMRFNAGHALNYRNVQPIASLPGLRELHIGHAIVSRALFVGLRPAVAEMKQLMISAAMPAGQEDGIMNTINLQRKRSLEWRAGLGLAMLVSWWALGVGAGCSSPPATVYSLPPLPAAPPGVEPFTLLKTGDRILFLGDDLTRQGFYTRAVASALMSIKPESALRFYNGGYNGVTSGSAQDKADELMEIVHPTVVFICVGLNDPARAAAQPPAAAPAESVVLRFRENLNALVSHVKQAPGVRMVVVLSPPAIQESPLDNARARFNETYKALAAAAGEVAAGQQVIFGDLYDYTRAFNESSTGANVPLSFSGNLPNEPGHVVIASVILRGLGVTGAQLGQAHWSPLAPSRMAAFRLIWGTPINGRSPEEQARNMELADQSRDLYEGLGTFDEQFFRAWRLAGPNTRPKTRAQVLADAEAQWMHLEHLAQALAQGNTGDAPGPKAGH